MKSIGKQSGVIPYCIRDGAIEVLLISNLKATRWIIPKGSIEFYLSSAASAAKEAFEEAGIRGNMSQQSVGHYQYRKNEENYDVEVFLLEITQMLSEWPEKAMRERRWCNIKQAARLVNEATLKGFIKQLPELIESYSARKLNNHF